MGTGKIIRFDTDKGYGFIAQDGGGDDVFLHMNELLSVGSQIGTGTRLKFSVMDGARGLKAYGVHVIEDYHSDEEAADSAPAANGTPVAHGAPAANGSNGHAVSNGNGNGSNGSNGSGAVPGHASTNGIGIGNGGTAGNDTVVVHASPARLAALAGHGTAVGAVPTQGDAPAQEQVGTRETTDDDTCEVFSEEEFTCRITNLILESVPQLTGAQILQLRGHLLQFARTNSWVD